MCTTQMAEVELMKCKTRKITSEEFEV
jgi:hypothetical protein